MTNVEIASAKKKAKANGEKFFAGNVCGVCGCDTRYVRSGCCVECQRRRDKTNYSRIPTNLSECFSHPAVVISRSNITK